jgi:hypothetical protein
MSISVRRVATNTVLDKILVNNISDEKRANLYRHLERNVILQLRLNFRVSTYIYEFSIICCTIIKCLAICETCTGSEMYT